jgi:hypothetical protein
MGSSGFSLNCQTTAIGIVFETDIERARYDEGTAPNLRCRFAPPLILGQFAAATLACWNTCPDNAFPRKQARDMGLMR